jgi:integrase
VTRQRGNGEGSIYQRAGRGGWYAAVTDAGRRKILRGVTRQEVARQLDTALDARNRGQLVTAPSQTLEAYLNTWLEQVVRQSVRPRTYISYEGVVRLHIVPTLGRTRLDRLAPSQVQQLLNIKLAAGLSPRSVDYIRQVLKTALAKAVRWGLTTRNAAQLADGPRVESHEVQPFTPDEARAFLSAVRGDRLEALYSVALAVGLRQGEALGLQWSDIDLEDGLIHVRYQLQRLGGRLQLVPLKTTKSRRTVALPASIVTKLREHRRRQLDERPAIGDGYVFATAQGAPLDAHNVLRVYKAVLVAAGLPDKRFHDLRHSCATLLLVQGTPIRVVMDLLGHSQISLTANTYSHVLPELRREAAERMEAVLQG